MKGFPKFKSPLVIRPKPKQFVYLLLTLIGYLALQGWRVFRAVTSLDVLTVITAVLLMLVTVWHVWRVRRYAEADVTEMLISLFPVRVFRSVAIVSPCRVRVLVCRDRLLCPRRLRQI